MARGASWSFGEKANGMKLREKSKEKKTKMCLANINGLFKHQDALNASQSTCGQKYSISALGTLRADEDLAVWSKGIKANGQSYTCNQPRLTTARLHWTMEPPSTHCRKMVTVSHSHNPHPPSSTTKKSKDINVSVQFAPKYFSLFSDAQIRNLCLSGFSYGWCLG